MKKLTLTVLILAAVAFLVAYFGSPFLAVRQLVDAAEAGDAAKLERQVDFPAFRASLKEELNARLAGEMTRKLSARDSALGGLGMLLAPSLVSGAVDALVTPNSVSAMVREARAPNPRDAVAPPADTRPEGDKTEIRQSYRYRSFDTFVLTLTDEKRPDRTLDLLMERRGLFDWKLAGIDLTPDE